MVTVTTTAEGRPQVPSQSVAFTGNGSLRESSSAPRTEIEMMNLDVEIRALEAVEADLLNKFATIRKRRAMSGTDYNRRRDELNRLLQQDEQEMREIVQERDQALKDLKNVESAYADVQEKYDRVMRTLLSLKEKEELLLQRDNENMLKLKQMNEKLAAFKQNAHTKVEMEYHSWLSRLADAEGTNVRLKAMIRKAEMKVEKLEHDRDQKERENNELHTLCDELIHADKNSKT